MLLGNNLSYRRTKFIFENIHISASSVKIIFIKSLKTKTDFNSLFKIIKKSGYNRVLIESGLIFLNTLIRNELISNLYVFQSSMKLGKFGINNSTNKFIKEMNFKNKIKVNLSKDNLYKIKIN